MSDYQRVLILGAIFIFLYIGNRIRKELGPVDDYRYQTFMARFGDDQGLITMLIGPILWIFWCAAYGFLGAPSPLPVPAKQPEPPKPDETTEPEIDDQLNKLRVALQVKYDHLPPNVLDAILATSKRMLRTDFTPPKDGNDKEWMVKCEMALVYPPHDRLFKIFTQFIEPFLKLPNGSLSIDLADLTNPRNIRSIFSAAGQNELFKKTFSNFAFQEQWGLDLTRKNSVAEKLGIDQIGQRNSAEHVRYLLKDYPELRDLTLPFRLPQKTRFEGAWVVAPQGRGKTTLLSALMMDDLEDVADGKASIIVMDSKGDLIDHLRQAKVFAPGQPLDGRLVLIEPSGQLAINPLDIGASTGHTISLMEYVFSGLLDTQPTAAMLLTLRMMILACKTIPNATLMTVRDILINGWAKYDTYIHTADEITRDYFMTGQFDGSTAKQTRDALRWRIDDLITKVDMLKDMFRSPTTKIDMGSLMDAGCVIVIDNSTAKLTPKGAEFFGKFFVALTLAAAQQRAGRKQEDKTPVYLYVDEAQTIIENDPNIATIIHTCRSQNIAPIFSHQNLSQITEPKVLSALSDTAIHMRNDDDTKLPKGKFNLNMRDWPVLTVNVPNHPASNWLKMDDAQLKRIREDMATKYNRDPLPPPQPVLREEEPPKPAKWITPKAD